MSGLESQKIAELLAFAISVVKAATFKDDG